MGDVDSIIARIGAALGRIDGVVAVVLGGSRALGTARPDSDIDLGIYYAPEQRPSITALRALAREVDDRHLPNLVTDFGEWGPWINGGGWLRIDGLHVDWLYRDLARVRHAIDECRAGRPTCDYQIGHPHAFHNHIYMGEAHHARALYDPTGTLAALKALTHPYPAALRRALIDKCLFEAHFSLEISRKPLARGDAFYVSGCWFRCVASLMQVLFALNERYVLNEKGAVALVDTLAARPAGFSEQVAAVFGADDARTCLARLEALMRAVRELCGAAPAALADRTALSTPLAPRV